MTLLLQSRNYAVVTVSTRMIGAAYKPILGGLKICYYTPARRALPISANGDCLFQLSVRMGTLFAQSTATYPTSKQALRKPHSTWGACPVAHTKQCGFLFYTRRRSVLGHRTKGMTYMPRANDCAVGATAFCGILSFQMQVAETRCDRANLLRHSAASSQKKAGIDAFYC